MNLKNKIEHELQKADVKYRFIPLPESLPLDIASHAAFHKIGLNQAMATILYKTEKGIIGAVKRADTQINQVKLKQAAEVHTLVLATKEDLQYLGVETGLVPYIGLEIPYYVDKKVLEVGKAYGTGGTRTIGMSMEASDMVKVNRGIVADISNLENAVDIHGEKLFRIVSGITPSGDGSLHIGNYLGAVRQFIEISRTNECFLFIADLHALTTIQNRETLEKNTESLILNELALLGGSPAIAKASAGNGGVGKSGELENIIFFRQSDVQMHTELQSILNNVTPLGLLKRAHAYKDKLAKDVMEDDVNMGLFSYPMLMAADILLYKPDLVPVGRDQKQHIEITRDIAERFNRIFKGDKGNRGDRGIFKLPEAYIPEETAVVPGTDGQRKMSKSLGNTIGIFDDEAVIRKQVMGAYTDPTRAHATDPGHIEGNMVFAYLDHFGERTVVDQLKEKYLRGGVGDVEVKEYLYESLLKSFSDARRRYQELKESPKKVRDILESGAEKARAVAAATMREVRAAIGLTNRYSFFDYDVNPKLRFRKPQSLALDEESAKQGSTLLTIDEFARVEMRVGKVLEAANVEKSEKLIRLVVDLGPELGQRVIFTGVRPFGYTPEDFSGKQFFFVVNLAPRKMLNEYSQGMILAVDGPGMPLFLSADDMPIGAKIR